ncbi:MAG: hypothetical protein RLY86_1395 [Pseudomonadota bacterium]|jgi:hypothetical protein
MDRSLLLGATVMVAVLNGLFSPHLLTVYLLWPVWFPTLVVTPSGNFVLFFSSLILSTTTLMVSAAVAALYERLRRLPDTTSESAGVWLAAAVLLSGEALLRLV